MKTATATDVRKNWFRLLDEVAAGEVIVLERKGRRIVLRREEPRRASAQRKHPDYRRLLRVPDAHDADSWSWEWPGTDGEIVPVKRENR